MPYYLSIMDKYRRPVFTRLCDYLLISETMKEKDRSGEIEAASLVEYTPKTV